MDKIAEGSLCGDIDVLRGVQPDVLPVQGTLLEGNRAKLDPSLRNPPFQAKAQLPLSLEAFPEVFKRNSTESKITKTSAISIHLQAQEICFELFFSFRCMTKWADKVERGAKQKLRKHVDCKRSSNSPKTITRYIFIDSKQQQFLSHNIWAFMAIVRWELKNGHVHWTLLNAHDQIVRHEVWIDNKFSDHKVGWNIYVAKVHCVVATPDGDPPTGKNVSAFRFNFEVYCLSLDLGMK